MMMINKAVSLIEIIKENVEERKDKGEGVTPLLASLSSTFPS